MKTYFYRICVISLLLTMGLGVYGQGKKLEKTYNWKYRVNEDVRFTFSNYDCDLVVHTWDRPEFEYKMTVDATLRSAEDASRLDEYIDKLEFKHSPGSAEFNNRFWKSKMNVMGRKTIELKGEKAIRFSEFNMSGELWIPAGAQFNLDSKYSSIEVEDLNGHVKLILYNDKLYGGYVNENIEIAAKYSTLEFKDMKDIEADFYECNLEAGNIGNLTIASKYSTFEAGDAGKIEIDAYSDKFSFGNTGDIKFVDKYSDLVAGLSGNVEMECYSSTVTLERAKDTELKSKYGKYEIQEADNLNLTSSYSDKFEIRYLKTLNITESKYGTYQVDQLTGSLYLGDGYSDKFTISKTHPAFNGIKINGKYVDAKLTLYKDLQFRFRANVKYPKFDIDEEAMNVRIKIKESSQLEMEAIKGTETEGMPEFEINGYDMALTFTEF